MEKKQFRIRLRAVELVLAAVVVGAFLLLYDLQIVNGATYRERSVRKITRSETVEAARGNIYDTNGKPLITNRTSYNVTLDSSLLGEEEVRNPRLLTLLEICREEDVRWPDSLPISAEAPFVYTTNAASTSAAKNFETFLSRMNGWKSISEQGADALMTKMRAFFEVEESVSDADARALIGVLYELRLRSMDIVRTGYVFATDVGMDFISKVKEHQLTGVEITASTVRVYETTYAAHLLGRVGPIYAEEWEDYRALGYRMDDMVGKDGVERAFESYLHGTPGVRDYETNAAGRIVSEHWRTDSETGEEIAPDLGDDVRLTVDIDLQAVLEDSLAEHIPKLASDDTRGGAGVVLNVRDGGVLAIGSYPSFDLATIYTSAALYNEVLEDPLTPLVNRAVQGLYSPGSTFKMVTAVAGLEEGIINPKTIIVDTGVYRYYNDYQPACWYYRQYRRTHGAQTVTEALLNSCNVFFFDVGRRVGIEKLGEYAAAFGLGEKTGIEIPEYRGAMDSPTYTESLGLTWYGGLTLSVAIGQGNSTFTPLQLANYIATLVNGGTHYKVHLFESATDPRTGEREEYSPEIVNTVEIAPANLKAVKNGMLEVGNKYFRSLGVQVGAKTGSAQVASDLETDSLFVCFAPFDDPEIAIALIAERGGSGSQMAAVAADVMDYYFNGPRGGEEPAQEDPETGEIGETPDETPDGTPEDFADAPLTDFAGEPEELPAEELPPEETPET